MEHNVTQQRPLNSIKPLPIASGGTGAKTSQQALINLDAIAAAIIGQASGITPLDHNSKIPVQYLPPGDINSVSVSGPLSVISGVETTYQITDYDFDTTYVISAQSGSIRYNQTTNDDQFYFTAAPTPAQQSFTINGTLYTVDVISPKISKPIISSPINNAVNQAFDFTFAKTLFDMDIGTDTYERGELEIATDITFTTLQDTVPLTVDLSSEYFSLRSLFANTTYYLRYRQKGILHGWSEWSDTITFTTRATVWSPFERQEITRKQLPESNLLTGKYNGLATNGDGDIVVIGCDYAYGLGLEINGCSVEERVGALLIYKLTNGIWTLVKIYQEPRVLYVETRDHHARFGEKVVMSDNGQTIVVSATEGGISGETDGKFYVYKTTIPGDYNSLALIEIVTPSHFVSNTFFPNHLAISGDGQTIIATQTNSGATLDDGIYIYNFDGTTVSEITRITSAVDHRTSYPSINFNGTRLVTADMMSGDGILYVYDFNGTDWNLTATLDPAPTLGMNGWPTIISDDGNTIVTSSGYGELFFFEFNGTVWNQTQRIAEPEWNGGTLGGSPSSLALNAAGNLLLVGSAWQSIPANVGTEGSYSNTGAAYLYEKVNGTWEQKHIYYASDYETTAYFGDDVVISNEGDVIIVGSPYKFWSLDHITVSAVYIFA